MAGEVPDRAIAPLLEESLDDLYEHAPCGYLSALPDGLIVKVNTTFLEWTGYGRDDLVGARRFQDLLTAGGRIYHETHYAPLLRMQGSVREIALQIVRADGTRMPVLVNSVLRTAEGGTVVRTTVFDASDRRSYERELLEARRRETEARERTERLQQLTEALAGSTSRPAVAMAALEALLPALEAVGGTVESSGADGRSVLLASLGEATGTASEETELSGSGGAVGRLRLHFTSGEGVAESERAFLLAAARQCGQALERAALFDERERNVRRAEFLAALGQALEETPELGQRALRLLDLIVPELAAGARIEMHDNGHAAAIAELRSEGAALELPLQARGRPLGMLVLKDARLSEPGDSEFLADVTGRVALALENAKLYEHEREVARALQESMLTRHLPQDRRFLVATHYQPAVETMEVGGDWYDAFRLGDDRLAIVVGDVVGRGIEAASAMGQLRSAVRALAGAALDPSGVLERLDDFVEQVEIARSATLVYADLDLTTGSMRYACAGHPPPVLAAPGVPPVLLWDGRSPPLGAFAGATERAHAEERLEPGTRVLLYTDGLVERRGRSIDEGIDALIAAVDAHRVTPLPSLADRIPRSLIEPGGAPDDVCLLALCFGATQRFERAVAADVTELSAVRADLRAWLDVHSLDESDRSAIVLACSEAVANSIEHGCGGRADCSVWLGVAVEHGEAVIEVRDDGDWRPPPADTDRGRGLVLIRHFMDSVVFEHGQGTIVRMRRSVAAEAA